MERLTEQCREYSEYDIDMNAENCAWFANKLAEYEDLEESGRLVKLPCAVGSTVWVITAPMNVSGEFEDAGKPKELYKCKLVAYSIYIGGIRLHCEYNGMTIHAYLTDNNIGIDVFLTREAAEAKLKEAKAGNGI